MIYVDGLLRKRIHVIVMRTRDICFMINEKRTVDKWDLCDKMY
jgi:hypothetical protein